MRFEYSLKIIFLVVCAAVLMSLNYIVYKIAVLSANATNLVLLVLGTIFMMKCCIIVRCERFTKDYLEGLSDFVQS